MKINLLLAFPLLLIFFSCQKKDKSVVQTNQVNHTTLQVSKPHSVSYDFKVHRIDSLEFLKTFKNADFDQTKKITDVIEIRNLTKGRLTVTNIMESDSIPTEYYYADQIILDNGRRIPLNKYKECGLVAYFPAEKIVLSECGHTSDQAYHIITGDSTEVVGNPEFIHHSPTKKFRLNGWFPGQECISFFFQVKTEQGYKKIFEIETFDKKISESFCNFSKFYWRDDYNFMFKIKNYIEDSEKGKDEYYRLEILEK